MEFEREILDEPAYYVAPRLHEELAKRLGDLDLDVELAGGLLVVSGHVTSTEQRDAVFAICAELVPDMPCRNDTTLPRFGAPEPETIT